MVGDNPDTMTNRVEIARLIGQAGLPAIYPFAELVEAGGLMAYSFDLEHVVFDWNRDSQKGRFLIQTPCWARGPAWMTRPYSEDIRERALARADAGETVRSIAEALQISPSCVTKWKNLRRDTGGLSPGKIGGHKKRVLSDANADWLRKRIRSGPFTLRKLTQELAERGIKTDVRAVWTFVHTERLSFKKNDPSHRTRPPRRRP